MKNKKYTTSKTILFLSWIFPIVFAILIVYSVLEVLKTEMQISIIATIIGSCVTAFTASIAIAGYTVKWYMKKSAMENIPKIRLGIIEDSIILQKRNPDYSIYDKTAIRNDVSDIIKPMKNEEQKTYEKFLNDDTESKIN